MMPGLAKVEMSPTSLSFWAIFLNIRRVIFPVRTATKGEQGSGSLQQPQKSVPKPTASRLPWGFSPWV